MPYPEQDFGSCVVCEPLMEDPMRYTPAFAMLAAAAASPAVARQGDSIGSVVTQPLRDTRIAEKEIPAILQRAASAPYSAANTRSCAAIATEVRALDAALGRDVDASGAARSERSAVAAVAARSVVGSLIPGLGIVRVITGADRQQRRAEAAVYAGAVRRGYLKGIGLSKRCTAPAAPTRQAVADTARAE